MTIKCVIPNIEWAIEWAIELLYNSVETGNQELEIRRVRDEDVVGNPHPAEGALGAPIELGTRDTGYKMW